jgi:hypothetical protein
MTLVLIVGFWILAIGAAVGLAKTWRVPADHRTYQRPPWWVWGDRWWRGYRRIQLPAALLITSWAVALTLGPSWGAYFALGGFAIFMPLAITVVLFNRPRMLAPPASRGDDGVVAEILRDRGPR